MMENVNNFLTEIIDEDICETALSERIHTRFPPEPNGYLHIGSAKAILHQLVDREEIQRPVQPALRRHQPGQGGYRVCRLHLGGHQVAGSARSRAAVSTTARITSRPATSAPCSSSRTARRMCDDLTQEEMREYRGSLTEPGKPSPYRDRSVEENLDLFRAICSDGKFADGSKHPARQDRHGQPEHEPARPGDLPHRARAPSPSGRQVVHLSACTTSPIPIQDALEGITHSLCSIEFENHRPLYDWVVEQLRRCRIIPGSASSPV